MFQEVSRGKVSVSIINQIREAILSGQLKPGDQLPPERELLSRFGVSRYTLREALRTLETMEFIDIRKGAGGGPVVREVGMGFTRQAIANFLHFQDLSITDLSEVRKLVEPYLARIMAENLRDEDLDYLASLNDACVQTLDRGEEIIGGEHEVDFHVYMARATGNPVLMMILDFVNKLLVEFKFKVKPGPEFSRRVVEAHERVLEALRARDGEAAARAMYDHVAEVEAKLLQLAASSS
jgi:GntR family transcriptional repressor for pyruvate dehydrogenase complex